MEEKEVLGRNPLKRKVKKTIKKKMVKKKKEKKEREISGAEKALIRPLLMLKKARLNYSESYGSVVPGFTPQSELFGQQDFSAPGWDYVLGAIS